MRTFVAPLQGVEDWPDDLPHGGLLAPSRWRAPVVIDERDLDWEERWAPLPKPPSTVGEDWRLGVEGVRLDGALPDPCMSPTPGDIYCRGCGWAPALHFTVHGNKAIITGEAVDSEHNNWRDHMPARLEFGPDGRPVDLHHVGDVVTVGGIDFTKISDDPFPVPFGPENADEMRDAVARAGNAAVTGYGLDGEPLDPVALAAAQALAQPPFDTAAGMTLVETDAVPPYIHGDWTAHTRGVEPAVFEPVRFSAPVIVDSDGATVPPKLAAKRQMMIDIVQAYSAADPRSQQAAIGPSEVGDPCDARVTRKLLGFPAVTWPDPWASFVGTAVHEKLAAAFAAANESLGRERFMLERRVWPSDGMGGNTDLAEMLSVVATDVYPSGRVDVFDHKVLGTDSFRQTKNEKLDAGTKYGVQLDLYGLGWRNAGYDVNTINLALWPRSGFLNGLLVIERKPDFDNARRALDRLGVLSANALGLGADESDEPWAADAIKTAPGKGCGFCPYFQPNLPTGRMSCDRGRDYQSGAKAGTGPRGTTP